MLPKILFYGQIIVSVLLIVVILLQERSSGIGGAFGGGSGGEFYQTRRGIEKSIYWATIGLGIAFVGLAVANLLI